MKRERVVLAYSGGLDTSVAIHWLREKYGLDVVAVCVDLGQGRELKEVERKAWKLGCVDVTVEDAREVFCDEFVSAAIRANALYEGQYPLSTALARPLIARCCVLAARRVKAGFVAHGSTGKGNDQVRFDVSFASLAPDLKVIAPVREWDMTRGKEIEYAKKHGIPVPVDIDRPYSADMNLWGKSTECGVLEDPWRAPPRDAYDWVRPVEDAPDRPESIEINFKQGVPCGLNGKPVKLINIIEKLNALGAKHGVGFVDMMENRLVGIKSRETYEAPGATIIITAHRDIESLTLTRDLHHFKRIAEERFSELIYDGLWYTQLREALDAFFRRSQRDVEGTVRVRLFKGRCLVVGRKSGRSLYDEGLATYDAGDVFDHSAAAGFIHVWGLPHATVSRVERKRRKKG
ncbi:MAG: argininosuccinate synthase [bacterium]